MDDEDWAAGVVLPPSRNELKQAAHDAFDPLWQTGLVSRKLAYEMLAAALGVREPMAHMTVMSRENLLRVPEIAERLIGMMKRAKT